MADEDIAVTIEEEKPEPKTETVVVKSDPAEELTAQLNELKAQSEQAKQAQADAQRRADTERQGRLAAEQERDANRSEVAESRIGSVESGMEASKIEADAAQAEYISAQEQGDWKKAAEAQRKIARAESKILRFEEAKSDLEAQKAAPRVERTAQPADPVEAFIGGRTAATQTWLRAHPDEARILALRTDTRKYAKLLAADNDAEAEGIDRDTPEYFAHVEKYIGLTKEGDIKVAAHVRKAPAPVAPVTSSSGGTNGGYEVRLTKSEALSATDGTLTWNYNDPKGKFKKGEPIGIQEMARRKKSLTEQGAYDRTYLEQ